MKEEERQYRREQKVQKEEQIVYVQVHYPELPVENLEIRVIKNSKFGPFSGP